MRCEAVCLTRWASDYKSPTCVQSVSWSLEETFSVSPRSYLAGVVLSVPLQPLRPTSRQVRPKDLVHTLSGHPTLLLHLHSFLPSVSVGVVVLVEGRTERRLGGPVLKKVVCTPTGRSPKRVVPSPSPSGSRSGPLPRVSGHDPAKVLRFHSLVPETSVAVTPSRHVLRVSCSKLRSELTVI